MQCPALTHGDLGGKGKQDYRHVSDGQMISRLQMPNITYVHTAQRETISIHEAIEKAVMTDKMKLYGLHTSTLRIHSCAQSVYSCVRLYDIKTDMLCVV